MNSKPQIDCIRRVLPFLESGEIHFSRRDRDAELDNTQAEFVDELKRVVAKADERERERPRLTIV
jgi:hypothetical protein